MDSEKTTKKPSLKSGRTLEQWIHSYLATLNDDPIKSDSIIRENLAVTIFRSNPFENLIANLKKISVVGSLAHQHDGIKVFLNQTYLKGSYSNLEQSNPQGMKIDITHIDNTFELKTRRNVTPPDIRSFIADFFKEMVKKRQIKHHWWLVYFMKRTDAKAKKGRVCMYYLVLIEINVQ
jgi:hypothetical protein